MPRVTLNFRQAFSQHGGVQAKLSSYVLGLTEAATAQNCQVSEGILTKAPGWLRLDGITPTGYAITIAADATGVSFPDHVDYDLGYRWTADVTYKATSLPAASSTHPIWWRADNSNNQVTTLELDENGAFLFTHRDASGTETTLTSSATIGAGEQAQVRVARWNATLRMWVDRTVSASRTDLSTTDTTAATDNKLYIGTSTVTDGDTTTAAPACRGTIDEFRLWRDELQDDDQWAYSEWPDLQDERLVLYARFNETSGSVIDYSKNGNDGTVIGSPTQGATALVTALAPIQKLFHFRSSAGVEKWCIWSNGSFYAEDVI